MAEDENEDHASSIHSIDRTIVTPEAALANQQRNNNNPKQQYPPITAITTSTIPIPIQHHLLYILTHLSIPISQSSSSSSSLMYTDTTTTTPSTLPQHSMIGPIAISILQRTLNILSTTAATTTSRDDVTTPHPEHDHDTHHNSSSNKINNEGQSQPQELSYWLHPNMMTLLRQLIVHNQYQPPHYNDYNNNNSPPNSIPVAESSPETATSIWLSLVIVVHMYPSLRQQLLSSSSVTMEEEETNHLSELHHTTPQRQDCPTTTTTIHNVNNYNDNNHYNDTGIAPFLIPLLHIAQLRLQQYPVDDVIMHRHSNDINAHIDGSTGNHHHQHQYRSSSHITDRNKNSRNKMIVQQWQIFVGYMIQSWIQSYHHHHHHRATVTSQQQLSYLDVPPNMKEEESRAQEDVLLQHLATYLSELIEYTMDIVDHIAILFGDHSRTMPTTMNATERMITEQLFPYLTICIDLFQSLDLLWCTTSTSTTAAAISTTTTTSDYCPMLQQLQSTYQCQLVRLWTTMAMSCLTHRSGSRSGSPLSDLESQPYKTNCSIDDIDTNKGVTYRICDYQLQLTALVLAFNKKVCTRDGNLTNTNSYPSLNNNTIPNPIEEMVVFHLDIPNERTILFLFLRAMEFPDLLLSELNTPLWYFVEQQMKMTTRTTTTERPQSPNDSRCCTATIPEEQRKCHYDEWKRMIQAATLTLYKGHMLQMQQSDLEHQHDQYDDDDNNNERCPISIGFYYRALFDRLVSIHQLVAVTNQQQQNTSRSTDNSANDDNDDDGDCHRHDMMPNDPWDEFFWKTIHTNQSFQ
jgi:hypothetical protein